jgi:hypothetical protein
MRTSSSVLDFTGLASPVRDARPIVLFLPGLQRRYTTFTGWIDALRCFGYDIRTVGKHEKFREALQSLAPDIVCLSAVERHIGHLAQAYREIAEFSPGAVTLLGGYAAYPSAADFFDIVVPGEGDIVMPLLLRYFQGAIAAGKIPTDLKADGGMLPAHLPIEVSDEIRALETRRVLSHAGVASEIAVDAGSHLYIRGRDDNGGLHAKFSGDRVGWPIPMNGVELNTLWRVPGNEKLKKGMFYARRGCKPDPDKRCRICSITSPTGRGVKPGDAVDALREFRSRGAVTAMLADENFSNSLRWTHEFLDGIEREGLFGDMMILMQTRADTWNEELVRRFWDMGILVGVGLETMHPLRAERLGKVREGRGERYVERGEELLRLGAEYARENGAWLRDMLRVYMISAGIGDTVVDVVDDMLVQFRLMREIEENGRGLPWLSYNLTQIIHAHSRAFEEMGSEKILRATALNGLGKYIGLGEETEVDMGPFIGAFYPFYVDESGGAHGILRPRDFKMGGPLAKFMSLMHREIYGDKKPNGVLNPEIREVHGAAAAAFGTMRENGASLRKAFGSRDRVDDVMNEILRLYAETYPRRPE